jgi:outer membrane lipoprotein-sorting protein
MRKILAIASLAAVALIVWAQGSGTAVLNGFAKALSGAESLSADYTVMRNLGAKEAYKIEFAKPNKLKIDKPNELIVADGTTITTYDKVAKTYFKRPQTQDELVSLLKGDEINIWTAFFDANVYAKTPSKNLGKANRKGMVLNVIESSGNEGKKKVTFYIDSDKSLARQVAIVNKNMDGQESIVVDTTSVVLGSVDANAFAFTAPAGSRELSMDELNSSKWYSDLDEALLVARRTKRLVMVDFFTEW